MANFYAPQVQAWRSAVEQLAGGLPGERAVDRVLRWMSIESGGNPCSIDGTKKWQDAAGWIQDAGVMQIYFDTQNSVVNGATSASLRASCVGTSQMQAYMLTPEQMVAHLRPQIAWLQGAVSHAQAQLDAVGANWPERDQWRWYKMVLHGLPAFARCMLWMATRQLGRAPMSWDEFRDTADLFTTEEIQAAAADPAENGCTAALQHHGAWGIAWNNAEEMDLPDEGNTFVDVLSRIVGPFSDSREGTGLSTGDYVVYTALGLLGAVGGYFLERRLARRGIFAP